MTGRDLILALADPTSVRILQVTASWRQPSAVLSEVCISGSVHLPTVDSTVTPVIEPLRRFPLNICEGVEVIGNLILSIHSWRQGSCNSVLEASTLVTTSTLVTASTLVTGASRYAFEKSAQRGLGAEPAALEGCSGQWARRWLGPLWRAAVRNSGGAVLTVL
ncbi:unnamed protein product [Arctogadus glacialis]